ncbi:MAG TPA: sulfotransferase domain-containing protein [Gammaproteobacteria bacterium]|nr:sulfotransferase domain-containing protein [Gammaproteobacteria bacterium]
MPFPPDVFLIGAQKAGTTTLAEILDSHPGVTLSDPKEPHFFTKNLHLGWDWYRECFPGGEDKILVDASTSYAAGPLDEGRRGIPLDGVPELIHEVRPEAKFIYMVREPVSRTYSAYWHDVRLGLEDLPFWEALEREPMYLELSDYAAQLRKYLELFDLESFAVLTFEEFKDDPVGVANRCFELMGLETLAPEEIPELHKNRSYTYSKAGRVIFQVLGGAENLDRIYRWASRAIPEGAQRKLKSLMTKEIPPMEEWQRKRLEHYFMPKNAELRRLTGLDTGYPEART